MWDRVLDPTISCWDMIFTEMPAFLASLAFLASQFPGHVITSFLFRWLWKRGLWAVSLTWVRRTPRRPATASTTRGRTWRRRPAARGAAPRRRPRPGGCHRPSPSGWRRRPRSRSIRRPLWCFWDGNFRFGRLLELKEGSQRDATGWSIRARTTFCWHWNMNCALVWEVHTVEELLIWCKHLLCSGQMGHPVLWSAVTVRGRSYKMCR